MAKGTRAAQLEEKVQSFQLSQEALKGTTEQHGALLAEIIHRLEDLKGSSKDMDSPSSKARPHHANSFGTNGGIHTRSMKLEFPRFDGTNPSSWLFKAKQYFCYHQVPEDQWLTVASLNMEGDAMEWYQWYNDYSPGATWGQFVLAMDARFGPTKSEDFAGKLSKLRPTSAVLDYQREFQRLSNRVKGLSEPYLVNLYLSGLEDDIRIGVQKLSPTNLPNALSLARLREEEANLRRRMFRTDVGRPAMGKEFQLKGIPASNSKLVDPDKLAKNLPNSVHAYAIQLVSVAAATTTPLDPQIPVLLNEFEDVFMEPKGLPPHRAHDHAIPLLEGTSSVNVKPYRSAPPVTPIARQRLHHRLRNLSALSSRLRLSLTSPSAQAIIGTRSHHHHLVAFIPYLPSSPTLSSGCGQIKVESRNLFSRPCSLLVHDEPHFK
ncbi:hypothetical protein MRB53_020978 [Persea americana]|uniref:Uncharacterized protein n=1 Tax=Persea americana TaxID=3435 RepID=A0ACC2L2A9_PERAE|nr:hypothetical protein MRB53_020978 [Persea americana]